jgi:hypothetical protein
MLRAPCRLLFLNVLVSIRYSFINADSKGRSCPSRRLGESNDHLNDFHFRGTSVGGWLVLEPWITPSLFYQFLGASEKWGDDAPSHVAFDSHTFCTALGKEEANKQLRRHWKTWVTEDQVKNLKASGAETLRVPVGDWMYVPYEPYIGCMVSSTLHFLPTNPSNPCRHRTK